MKKFYSFMLLAAAMLLSVSVKADVKTVGSAASGATYQTLLNAFNNASDGDTIKLLSNIESNDKIHINHGNLTLDLNGDTIKVINEIRPFYLYKGTFKVTGKGGIVNYKNESGVQIFYVYGTFAPVEGFTSHLIIDEDVKLIVPNGPKGRGIHVATSISSEGAIEYSDLKYNGILGSSHGYANGVVVDIYGDIEVTTAEGYCVQVSGRVRYPGEKAGQSYTWGGTQYTVQESWKDYAPHINLYGSCHLSSNNEAQGAAAMYAAGYAIWDIRCTAEGSCALAAKSGNITITDATLKSTAAEYLPVTAKTEASGIDVKGTAVAIESNKSYAGNISVTFAGDTHIEAKSGYAVEEAITNATGSKISSVTILGGSFQGGNDSDAGCITISEGTLNNPTSTITIGGGSYTAQDQYQQDKTQALLEKLLGNNTADPEYTIAISNGTNTGTGMSLVISPTVIPSPIANPDFNIEALEELVETGGDINLAKVEVEGGILILDENLEMENLFMNCEQPLSIVIPNGFTLTAKRIVMGENDNITIQAGGKLVVTGDQGVYAVNVNNLIIEAEEGNMGIFLFKPSVAANRHPHATVQLISKAHQEGNKFVWQRFGIPAYHGFKKATIQRVGHSYNRAYRWWNPAINDWDVIATDQIMTPFTGFTMTSDAPAAGTKYAMPCDSLYGNVNAIVKHIPGWNYFANSYTGKIDVAAFLSGILKADAEYYAANNSYLIEDGVHVNTSSESNNWVAISEYDVKDGLPDSLKTLAPMQAFVTKLLIAEDYKDTLNYEAMVWNPAMGVANSAPARRNMMASDYTKAVVEIANGENVQMVTLRQGSQFSNEFDNGAEVSAFKAGEVSMYATTEYGEMAQIASDNLIGQTLTIESAKAASFKMTFKNLRGETLAIRDNFTGSVINMTEGAEYYFSVAPNTTEARFEIVEAAKMPTDVETLEAAPAKKGIFSLQGQYLGENFHVLPAGIYVVNGVKVVK